jgi:predicted alpha/beta hydrolase
MSKTPSEDPSAESIAFKAADGYLLRGTLFVPRQPLAVVVLSGGTAIPHRYYHHYARFLAAHDYACLSYDYRGVGVSRQGALRGFQARMRDWGTLDQRAALAEARRQFPDLPLVAMGHSVGGQMLAAAVTPALKPDLVIHITVSTGTWWRFPLPYGLYCGFLWNAVVPVSTSLLGYFPASRLGLGEDLPAGVAREWARWCRRADYCGELAHSDPPVIFDAVRAPLLAVAATDDPIANRRTVPALHALYPHLRAEMRWVAPSEFGMKQIGHLGFFRPRAAPALQRLPVDWLDARLRPRALAAAA